MLVIGDDRVGGGEDVAHAAVVLLELNRVRLGEVVLELEDVAQIGAAPRVDGLVVVANYHDVLVPCGQKHRDLVLRVVGVLVLVHHDVTEAILVRGENLGVVLQQQIRINQQIVEVERVRRAQALLQTLVHARRHLADRIGGLNGEIRGRSARFSLEMRFMSELTG